MRLFVVAFCVAALGAAGAAQAAENGAAVVPVAVPAKVAKPGKAPKPPPSAEERMKACAARAEAKALPPRARKRYIGECMAATRKR